LSSFAHQLASPFTDSRRRRFLSALLQGLVLSGHVHLTKIARAIGAGSPANALTFTYDAAGNRRSAANTAGAYTFTYDKLNRKATEQQPFGLSLTHTYDAADNRTKLEDARGGVTTSTYDAANRLTRREFGGTGQTPLRLDLIYTPRDQPDTLMRYSDLAGAQKVGSTRYHYDPARRMDNLKHRDAADAVFWNTTYGYDAADRLTSERYNGTLTTFGYDATNQLTGASGGAQRELRPGPERQPADDARLRPARDGQPPDHGRGVDVHLRRRGQPDQEEPGGECRDLDVRLRSQQPDALGGEAGGGQPHGPAAAAGRLQVRRAGPAAGEGGGPGRRRWPARPPCCAASRTT
jgi:YD repeat-containing protein